MQVLNLDAELNISRLDADIRTLRLGEGGTTNYNDLTNKPSINSVTLTGNKTTSDLNIKTSDLVNDAGFITNANIPTKTSDLTNDDGFQTAAQVSSAVAAAIPTEVSAFTNDAGYITAAQVGNIPTKTSDLTNDSGFITSAEAPVQSVNGYTGAVTLVASDIEVSAGVTVADGLSNLASSIPTKTSDLVNDSGFITSLNVPSKTSDLVNDSGFVTNQIDDSTTAATSTWSSDKIVSYSAPIPQTATITDTPIVSFSDGADNVPVSELIVDIDADPGGFTEANVTRCGKNILEPCITSGTVNGITYTVNDDGTITLSNTATSESKRWGFFDLKAGSYIYTSGVTESLDTYDTYLSVGGTTIARGSSGYNSFTLEQDSNVGLTIRVRNGITPDITIKPMIRLASETSSDYEPYNGTTYNIPFGQTVTTGGTLNVTTGVLEITGGSTVQLTPTEVRTLLNNNNIFADTGNINELVYFKTGCEALARLIEAYT